MLRRFIIGLLVLMLALALLPGAAFGQSLGAPKDPAGPVEVSSAVYSDVSAPVRDLVGVAPAAPGGKEKKDKPLRSLPNMGNALNQTDGALQSSSGPLVGTTNGLNFAGVGQGDYGFSDQYAPPDTNGAVGATQYVQWVNTYFAVFDKSTGAIAAGFPKAGNSIWAGFGGGCQTNNDGDLRINDPLPAMRCRVDDVGCDRIIFSLRLQLWHYAVQRLSQAGCVARRLLHQLQHLQ